MVNFPIEGKDVVLEAGEDKALEGNGDHQLLLILVGLSGRRFELGFDLVSPAEHLRGGDAGLAAIFGHPGAGHVPESHVLELLAVAHDGQVQAELHSVHLYVQARLEPLIRNNLCTVINI